MRARHRLRRTVGAAVLAAALTVPAGAAASAATAPTGAAQVEEQARAAAERADRLARRVRAATRAYEQARAGLTGAVSREVRAGADADAAATAAAEARRAADARVRALYMAGGRPAVYAGVLVGGSPHDVARRWHTAHRVLDAGRLAATAAAARAAERASTAQRLDAEAARAVTGARELADRLAALDAARRQAAATLTVLTQRARRLATAERAAAERRRAAAEARLRAALAAAAAASAAPQSQVRAVTAPADWRALYVEAAGTCPGLPWQVLSAVGQVETGHGRNTAVSSAGAQGPMQFMPATFAAYGVDGDGDGDRDVLDPTDAVHSAASYLCASGAGEGPAGLRRALYAYNHATWYVDLVLGIADDLPADPG